MKTLINYDFINNTYEDLQKELLVRNTKGNVKNYKEFMLINPKTTIEFPKFDRPFFNRMNATLKHKLHCYKEGWITSERQIFYSSDECMTTIQFVFDEQWSCITMNVFMRSSNLRNLDKDLQFLNYFLEKNFDSTMTKTLNVFVSMPHIFLDRLTKVDK